VHDIAELRRRRDEIIAADGPWTAVDVELAPGLRTSDVPRRADDPRVELVTQTVLDLVGDRPRARVLDIGCLEGMFSLELAKHGLDVVGVDVREANITKARFAAEALGVQNARFEVGDARELSVDKHGTFDVVLCLGVLYHLDDRDVPALVRTIGALCTGVAFFDTHVGFGRSVRVDDGGETYQGEHYVERRAGETDDEHAARPWASIDNTTSFWPTKRSLQRMIAAAGFTTILDATAPPSASVDRVQIVALKGRRATLHTIPPRPPLTAQLKELGADEWRRVLKAIRTRAFPRLPRWTRTVWEKVKDRP
jgi:SAM-dependent methyltransferase